MSNNKIITMKSFWSSGGSAVNDFLLEFGNIYGIKQQEITIFETIDGLMDLEYRFHNNKSNVFTGMQMEKFRRLVDYLSSYGQYSLPYDDTRFFDGYFKKRSYEFLDKISLEERQATLEIDWHMKVDWHMKKNKLFALKYKRLPIWKYRIASTLAKSVPFMFASRLKPIAHYFPTTHYYIPADKENFDKELQSYVNDLFSYLSNRDDVKGNHLLLDQMFNIDSFLKYKDRIKNLKYIIVDRDPRDIYLLQREKLKSLVVPLDAEGFISWFKSGRAGLNDELKKQCLYVRFENLIYDYENETKRIMDFLELDEKDHVNPKKHLNPDISIKNTQMFKKTDKYKEDIAKIEAALPEYLYDFPSFKEDTLEGIF